MLYYLCVSIADSVDDDIIKGEKQKIESQIKELEENSEVGSNSIMMVNRNDLTQLELNFLNEKNINIENLKTRWAWVNDELAIEFYRDYLIPFYGGVPTNSDLDSSGFRGFRNAVARIGRKMTEITKAAGEKPHFEIKYHGMSFEELVDLYKNKIYPELAKKLMISKGQTLSSRQLESNGYRGFVDSIYKRGKSFPEFQKDAGFEPLKEFNYAGKDYDELIEMFLNKIYPDLKEQLKLPEGVHPKKEEISEHYSGLLQALGRMGKTYNDLVKAAGFSPRMEHKYVGKNFEELVEMFNKEIYPDLKEKLLLADDEPPTREQVEKFFRGFTNALTNLNRYYPEIVKAAGLIPQYERQYRELSDINNFIEYYKNNIYPNLKEALIEEGIELKSDEAPTANQIREHGFGGFIDKLYQIASYNDLVELVGLQPNNEFKYKDMDFKDLVEFFREEIYPDLKSWADLKETEAPSQIEMTKFGYYGFFDAIYRTGKTYTDLVRTAGLIPRQSIESEAGTITHKLINLTLSEWLLSKKLLGFNYYGEVMIFNPINQFKIDGFVNVNDDLKNYFTFSFKNWLMNEKISQKEKELLLRFIEELNNKHFLLIDYSSALLQHIGDLNIDNIAKKIIKYRKNENSLLILVDTKWPNIPEDYIKELPNYIQYGVKQISTFNTKLISMSLFTKLIGLKGRWLNQINEIIYCNKNNLLLKLKRILHDYETRGIQDFLKSTKELKEYLITTSKIQESLSELFNPYYDPTTLDRWRKP